MVVSPPAGGRYELRAVRGVGREVSDCGCECCQLVSDCFKLGGDRVGRCVCLTQSAVHHLGSSLQAKLLVCGDHQSDCRSGCSVGPAPGRRLRRAVVLGGMLACWSAAADVPPNSRWPWQCWSTPRLPPGMGVLFTSGVRSPHPASAGWGLCRFGASVAVQRSAATRMPNGAASSRRLAGRGCRVLGGGCRSRPARPNHAMPVRSARGSWRMR